MGSCHCVNVTAVIVSGGEPDPQRGTAWHSAARQEPAELPALGAVLHWGRVALLYCHWRTATVLTPGAPQSLTWVTGGPAPHHPTCNTREEWEGVHWVEQPHPSEGLWPLL